MEYAVNRYTQCCNMNKINDAFCLSNGFIFELFIDLKIFQLFILMGNHFMYIWNGLNEGNNL